MGGGFERKVGGSSLTQDTFRQSNLKPAVPGKHTLTEQLSRAFAPSARDAGSAEIQRKAAAAPGDTKEPTDDQAPAAAEHGISGPPTALPHAEQIQRSFGRHSVAAIQAHTDEAADTGARALGAHAFALRHHVAFAGAPDLHTAAHEAAHVVQNRRGVARKAIDGGAGDACERHADAVADAVVAGASAESLLSAGPGAGATVQRKAEDPPGHAAEPDHAGTPLDALLARLTPAWAAAISDGSKTSDARDAELADILFGAFEANWFKAKECLLFDRWPGGRSARKPPHAACLDLMQALVHMRTRVCNEVAEATQRALPRRLEELAAAAQRPPARPGEAPAAPDPAALLAAEASDPGITPAQHATFEAPLGAQKRTSDIDVSISGRNTEIAMQLFNELFRERMNVPFDAATVFDYNVYAQDWMFGDRFRHDDVVAATEIDPATRAPKAGAQPQPVATRITPVPEHVISGTANDDEVNAALQRDRADILDEAALLHIRRNCSAGDWRAYTARRLAGVSGEQARITLRARLGAIDIKYKQFAAMVDARAGEIAADMGIAAAAIDQASAWRQDNRPFRKDALDTRAANALYGERMRQVKNLRLQYDAIAAKPQKTAGDLRQLVALAKDVTKALGEAGFFANEKYASEGAVLHTVIGIQKAGGDSRKFGVDVQVVLSRDQYMQSFHENVGDSLYSVAHYQQDPPYATYRAGKYIDRMLRAARALCGDEAVQQHPEYPRLDGIARTAAEVKGSDDGDDPARIAPHFADASAASLDTLKHAILGFGGDIPARSAGPANQQTAGTDGPPAPAPSAPAAPSPRPQNPASGPGQQAAQQTGQQAIDQLRATVDAVDDQDTKEQRP